MKIFITVFLRSVDGLLSYFCFSFNLTNYVNIESQLLFGFCLFYLKKKKKKKKKKFFK